LIKFNLLSSIILMPIWLSGCVSAEEKAVKTPPNILFIYTDDQAPFGMSLTGNDQLNTPHLDAIGKEGAYFTNFFTPTPVCSPTRATLLTSRYSTETGITDWINPSWDQVLNGTEPDLGLDSKFTTWVQLLKESGYRTGLVGKWHLGDNEDQRPEVFGYDYFMGFLGGGTAVKDPKLQEGKETREFKGFTTNILTEEAIQFIVSDPSKKPFMLSLHYRAPHMPWLPLPTEDWEPYQDLSVAFPHPYYPGLDKERLRKMTREYYGSISSVDRNVGRILNTLDSLGLDDNTLVIFTSDHGYNLGHNGIWHKGNGHWIVTDPPAGIKNVPQWQRPNLYDNSIKVPTVVRWPAKIPGGIVIDESVTVLDWFPTLLAAAGLEVPENLNIHGRSFLPLLKGKQVEQWDNKVFGQYSTHHQSMTDMRMIRTADWKLVKDFKNPERDELYNLTLDPEETNNLFFDPGKDSVKQAMMELLVEKMRKIDDPVLEKVEL